LVKVVADGKFMKRPATEHGVTSYRVCL